MAAATGGSVWAQKGMSCVELGIGYGITDSYSVFSGEGASNITIEYQYNINDHIRLEASAFTMIHEEEANKRNYYTGFEYHGALNLHYIIGPIRPLRPYIIVGAGYGSYKEDWEESKGTCFTTQLGAGLSYRAHPWSFSLQLKTAMASEMYATYLLAGIGYNF